MKREVISEAVNNISEEYRAEALESHNREVVSGSGNMKKKIVTIAVVAALITALGVTTYAAIEGRMSVRDAEPEETVLVTLDSELEEYVTPEGSEESFVEESQDLVYNGVTKIFTFEGPSVCNEIEIMTTHVPEGYTPFFGGSDEWTPGAQGVNYDSERQDRYNVTIFYTSDLGPDGSIFMMDTIDSESEEEDGDLTIYRLSGESGGIEGWPVYYYIMFNRVEGYIIVVTCNESMEECEAIADGLEIRTTGNTVEYDENDIHDLLIGNSLG